VKKKNKGEERVGAEQPRQGPRCSKGGSNLAASKQPSNPGVRGNIIRMREGEEAKRQVLLIRKF